MITIHDTINQIFDDVIKSKKWRKVTIDETFNFTLHTATLEIEL